MSSLKFIKDNDVIELLGEYVLKAYLKKKEKDLEDSREFHIKNLESPLIIYINSIPYNLSLSKKVQLGHVNDINKIPHYQIVSIINIVRAIYIRRSLDLEALSLSWLNEKLSKRIELYENFLNEYITNPWQFAMDQSVVKVWAFDYYEYEYK